MMNHMVKFFRNYFTIFLHPFRSHKLFRKRRVENLSVEKGAVAPLTFLSVVIPQLILMSILIGFASWLELSREVNQVCLLIVPLAVIASCIVWSLLSSVGFKIERMFIQFFVGFFGVKKEVKASVKETFYSSYCCQFLLLIPVVGLLFFFLAKCFYLFIGLKENLKLSAMRSFFIGAGLFIFKILALYFILQWIAWNRILLIHIARFIIDVLDAVKMFLRC